MGGVVFPLLARRAHFMWQVGRPGRLEVLIVVWYDRCRTWDTFSPVWQVWHFLHVATRLVGVSQKEKRIWRSFFVAGTVFGEVGERFERVENSVL